jgi:hypothetical protein
MPPPLDKLALKARVMLASNGVTKQTPVIRLAHGPGVTLLSFMKLRKDWFEKSKAFIKNDVATPKKVFTTYCEHMGLTEDQVINKINWDFFLDDEE